MDNQERNRASLVEHIAEQDRIIRRRNEQIAAQVEIIEEVRRDLADCKAMHAKQIENQAQNAREAQRAIEEQDALINSLATDLGAAVARAEKVEDTLLMVQQQRDHLRATLATTARQRDEADKRAATASPRPLTADDITDEMVERGARQYIEEDYTSWERSPALAKNNARESVRGILEAALTPLPSRPEGAEELQALIRQAEAEGEGADNEALANYLATRLIDPTVKEQS